MILVVDDVDMLVAALCWQLQKAGREVTTAPSVDLLDPECPSWQGVTVLLSDLLMPGADGVEVATVAREVDPEMKLICLTGLPLDSPRLTEARFVFDLILPKPCALPKLLAALP